MKDYTHTLTLQELEELCRLYMECQLSVLEEKELQYLLNRSQYDSDVILLAKESMIAEGLLFISKPNVKKPGVKWLNKYVGIAAALTILFAISALIPKDAFSGSSATDTYSSLISSDSSDEVYIVFENGKRLSPDASRKAVVESQKNAERLMAMAEKVEREEQLKQYQIMEKFK